MSATPYQLEKAADGRLFICFKGARLTRIPAADAAEVEAAIGRVEDTRGQQLAMHFLTLGAALAGPAAPLTLPTPAASPSLSPAGRGEGAEASR